jgi:RNA polymerase sigma factor (sigma-70 family)
MQNSQPGSLANYLRCVLAAWKDDPRDDAELLSLFAARNDEQAFTTLVGRHGLLVWGTCLRLLRNRHAAEDAFQDTFLTLARKAAGVRASRPGALPGWLHRVARSKALVALRDEGRRRKYEQLAPPAEPALPDAAAEYAELCAAFDEELDLLPEKYRSTLLLAFVEGLHYTQVAEALGCSVSTVYERLAQAQELLRQRLTRRGLTTTAGSILAMLMPVGEARSVPMTLLTNTINSALGRVNPRDLPAACGGVGLAGFIRLWAGKPALTLLLAALTLAGGLSVRRYTSHPRPVVPTEDSADMGLLIGDLLPDGPQTVRGQVLDEEGRAIPRARVALLASRSVSGEFGRRDDLLRQVQADDDGHFALEVSPALPLGRPDRREVKLLASSPGRAVGATALPLQPNMPPTLMRLPASRVVRGRVLGPDNRPAAGVPIHVVQIGPVDREPIQGANGPEAGPLPGWPAPAVTDGRGCFQLPGLDPRQSIGLEVRDDRFARELALCDGRAPDAGQEDLIIRLAPLQILEGQAVAADTGKPLPHARVSAVPCGPHGEPHGPWRHVDARADANGRFRVQLPAGSVFKVFACAPEGEPYLTVEQTVRWPAGSVRQELKPALPPGVALRGQVVEADTRRPVAGALVEYVGQLTAKDLPDTEDGPRPVYSGSAWTGPDGRFFVPAGGRALLRAFAPHGGYLPCPRETLPSEERDQYAYVNAHAVKVVELPADCREWEVLLTVKRGGRLGGRVLGPEGQPASAGDLITAGVFGQYLWTKARRFDLRKGAFSVPNADPSRNYPVIVLDSTRAHGTFAMLSGRATDPPPTLRLQRCGQAEGRMADRDGRPLADVPIELKALLPVSRDGPQQVEADVNWYKALRQDDPLRTDAAGRFTLPSLVQGVRYRLFTVVDGSRRVATEFKVTAGQNLQLQDVTPDTGGH